MAINNIDTTRPLRRPLELQQLVKAVVGADSADEAFWVECKNNGFDPAESEGRFKTARAILSFANRMPDIAATICGGLAYVIIGAEPGKVDGVALHDGADLDNWLIKYLGGDGPAWTPNYVKHGDKDVLVIVVEAPKWGDHAHTLRQAYDKAVLGTVYYRSGSVSRQANPDEIRLLEKRLVRGHQAPEISGLEVGYKFVSRDDRPGTPLIVIDPTPAQVDEWIERRRIAIRSQHQAVIDQIKSPPPEKLAARMLYTRPSIDNEAIEHHLEACRPAMFDATRRAMIKGGYGLVQVTAHNPGRRTLEHVQLTLTLETPHSAFAEGQVPEELESLPEAPELPQQRNTNPFDFLGSGTKLSALTTPRMPALLHSKIYAPHGIDIEDGSITLALGHIRPEKTGTSTKYHLFLHERPVDDKATVAWTLTSISTEGIQRGTFDIPIYPTQGVLLLPTAGLHEATGRT